MYNHILVPVALDHSERIEGAFKVASALLSEGGHITLARVFEDVPSYAQSYIPEGTLEAKRADALAALNEIALAHPDVREIKVLHGRPGTAILECVDDQQPDCIVIASHKPGLEDYFIGSTAARVVRHAKCCVHVMR